MESYLALATLVAACGAAKLDRAYLPPASASSAGGSAGSLQTPFGNHASAKSSVGNPGSLQIPFGNQSDQSPEGSAGSLQSLIDQHPAFAKSSAPGHHAFAKASSSPGGQASAKASAGSAGNKLNYGLGGPVPKGSYTNEYQGVVVDAALAGTRATGESGLGAPRPTYGSSDSKVGAAAFRDQPSRFNQTPQAQGQPGGSSGQGQQGQSGSQPDYNQGSQGFNQPQPNQLERPKAAQDRVATITKLEQEVGPENFNFAFETDNGIQAEETGVEANGVQAQGAFSYTGDDGNTYTVTYTADENGYQPKGDHLPTPPPIPEEILKSLEQNAKDEAAGIVDDGSYDAKKYNTGGDYTDDNNDGKYTHQFGANGEIDASASGSFIDQTRQPFGKPELSRPHNRPNSLGQNAKPGKFDYHGARPSASGSSNQLTGPDSQSAGQFSQSGAYSGTSNQENSGQSSGQFNQASSNSGFGFASAPQGNPSQGFGNGNEYLPPTNNYGQQSSQSQSQNHLQARPQSRPQARPQVSSNSESSFGSSNQLNGPDFQSTGQIGPSGAYNGTPNQENNGQYSGQFNQDSSNYNGFGFASGANAPQRNPSLGFVNGNKNVPPTNNYGQQSSQSQPQNRPQARPQSKPQARPQESGSSESGFGFSNQLTGPDSQSAGQFGPSGAYSRPPNQENNAQSLGQFNQAFSNSKLNNGFGFGSGANVPQGNPSQGFGNRNEYLPPTNNYGQQDSQRPQNRPQARPQNKPQNRPQDSGSSESSSSEENSSEEKGSVNIQPQQYSQEGSQEIFTTQGLPSRVSGKPNVLPGLSDFESRPIQGESQKLSTPQRFPSRVSSKPNAFPSQSSFGSKPTQNQLSGNGLKPSNNNNFGQSGQSNQAQSGFGNNNEYLPPFSQQHSQNGNATESNQQFNNQAPGFQSPLSLPGNSQGRPQSSFPGQAPTQAPSKLIPGFPSHQFNNLQRPQNGRPIQNGQFSQQNVAQFSQASAISTGFTPQPGNGLTTPIRSSNDQSQFDQSTPSPFPGGSSPFLIGSIQPQFGNQFNGQYSSPTSSFSSTPSFGSQPTFAPSPDSRPFENQYQGAQFISQAQNSFSQSQNVDSKFSPSTQRPSYAQPIGSDDSYIYNQPSQPFSGQEQGFPNLVASFPGQPSFPNEATSFPNKVSRFPSSNQRVTQSPSIPTDLYSNTPGNFPSTFSNSGFPKEVSSFPNQDSRFPSTSSSQKVTPSYPSDRYSNAPGNFPLTPAAQYSPQGPINYPNPPTLSSPAPTSSTQYQGNTVSGITQASISSFPSVASTQAPFNQQHQFQSRPGFQQSVNQYNPAQAPQSPNFESVSTTAAPQSFPQSPESQDQQSYGQESTQSTEDSSDAPESSQQYQGELYEYNKPAQTPPPPENEGQPGAGQFGSTTQDQKTTQPDSDGYQSTATPQFSSQETGRPQFGSQPSRPFSQNTLAPESSTEYPENQSTDDVPSRFGGDASRPEYNQNSQSPSQTGTQFSDGSSPLGSQTTEIPENEKPQELTTPAPFGLRPCCQGSSKFGPTARPGSSKLPSLQGPFGFNSQFNPDSPPKPSSSSFAGQGETFGGPDRKPPTFDENGYHY